VRITWPFEFRNPADIAVASPNDFANLMIRIRWSFAASFRKELNIFGLSPSTTNKISFKSSLTPKRQTAWLKVGHFCTPIYSHSPASVRPWVFEPNELLAPLGARLHAKLGIESIGSLTVDHQTFALHQRMQHQIAVAWVLLAERSQSIFHRIGVSRPKPIASRFATRSRQPTGLTLPH